MYIFSKFLEMGIIFMYLWISTHLEKLNELLYKMDQKNLVKNRIFSF